MSKSPEKPRKNNKVIRTPAKKAKEGADHKDIAEVIVDHISTLSTLKEYEIRTLVEQADKLGRYLANDSGGKKALKTNQVRKFLDAVKQIKVKRHEVKNFSDIEDEFVMLKPRLAYAAGREKAAAPLKRVLSIAIDKTKCFLDFDKFVQLLESIIAYHKASGGKE